VTALLELENVSKHYGAVVAVRSATVRFSPGRLHLVCGENGAGKSTLLKMGAGIVAPDSGAVRIAGKPLAPHTPAAALDRGVAMVTQHFALAPALTVLENVALVTTGRLDMKRIRAAVEEKQRSLGFTLPLDAQVSELTVGQKQRAEIVRALMRDANVVVLDEPTAVLARAEVDALYTLLRKLAAMDKAIVVVTHKMDEVARFADVVTVMRKGEVVWTKDAPREEGEGGMRAFVESTVREIMAGAFAADAESKALRTERDLGEVVLAVDDAPGLPGVSLTIKAGEIVGVAGVEGNGQAELVRAIEHANGDPSVRVGGEPKVHGDVSFVHEERQTMGLVLEASAAENLMLGDLASCERNLLIDRGLLQSLAGARARGVAYARGLDVPAGALSGGNQQKLVVGRALGRAAAKALVFVHPTRGVDLGASKEIHERIFEAAAKGRAVLVVSSDTDELRTLADRIVVLAKRAIAGEFKPDVSEEELGAAMLSAEAAT
jgi:simple sugar transport system ATP-binding protein